MIPENVARELLSALYAWIDDQRAGHNTAECSERLTKATDAMDAALDHTEPVAYRVQHKDWGEGRWTTMDMSHQISAIRTLEAADDWTVQPLYD